MCFFYTPAYEPLTFFLTYIQIVSFVHSLTVAAISQLIKLAFILILHCHIKHSLVPGFYSFLTINEESLGFLKRKKNYLKTVNYLNMKQMVERAPLVPRLST